MGEINPGPHVVMPFRYALPLTVFRLLVLGCLALSVGGAVVEHGRGSARSVAGWKNEKERRKSEIVELIDVLFRKFKAVQASGLVDLREIQQAIGDSSARVESARDGLADHKDHKSVNKDENSKRHGLDAITKDANLGILDGNHGNKDADQTLGDAFASSDHKADINDMKEDEAGRHSDNEKKLISQKEQGDLLTQFGVQVSAKVGQSAGSDHLDKNADGKTSVKAAAASADTSIDLKTQPVKGAKFDPRKQPRKDGTRHFEGLQELVKGVGHLLTAHSPEQQRRLRREEAASGVQAALKNAVAKKTAEAQNTKTEKPVERNKKDVASTTDTDKKKEQEEKEKEKLKIAGVGYILFGKDQKVVGAGKVKLPTEATGTKKTLSKHEKETDEERERRHHHRRNLSTAAVHLLIVLTVCLFLFVIVVLAVTKARGCGSRGLQRVDSRTYLYQPHSHY